MKKKIISPPTPLATLQNPILSHLSGHSNPFMLPFDTQVCQERQIYLRFHRILSDFRNGFSAHCTQI